MGKRGSLFLAGESTPFLANVERQWGRWGGSGVCVCGGVTSPLTQFHLGNFKHKHQSVSSVQLMLLMMSHVARNPRLKDGSRRHDSNTAHVYQFDKQAVLGRCYSDAHTHTHVNKHTTVTASCDGCGAGGVSLEPEHWKPPLQLLPGCAKFLYRGASWVGVGLDGG